MVARLHAHHKNPLLAAGVLRSLAQHPEKQLRRHELAARAGDEDAARLCHLHAAEVQLLISAIGAVDGLAALGEGGRIADDQAAAPPFVGVGFCKVKDVGFGRGQDAVDTIQRGVAPDKRERVGSLLQMHANHREDLETVYAGDIAAVVGLKNTTTGDTLCDEKAPIVLESMEFPEPVIRVAIEPKTKAGQEKMGVALAKLAEEDPTFRTYTDEETGQTIIAGMGELHLEIIVDRLLPEFKVAGELGLPSVRR